MIKLLMLVGILYAIVELFLIHH